MPADDLEARFTALIEQEQSLEGRWPRLAADWSALPDSAAGTSAWLEVDRQQEAFEQDYHALHLGRIELHLDRAVAAVAARLARGADRGLEPAMRALQAHRETYLGHRHLVRHGKDGVLRLPALRSFNAALLQLARLANGDTVVATDRVARGLRVAGLWAPLVGPLGRCLLATFFRGTSGPEQTPQLDALRDFYLAFQRSAGLRLEWLQPERLRPSGSAAGEKVLDLYVLAHASTLLDAVASSAIGQNGVAPCLNLLAAGNALPPFLTRTLDRSDHLILVGTGASDPIAKLLSVLERKRVRRLLLYPEGSVSSGLFELRHIREKFNPVLLRSLHEAGYRLRLHPIVFPRSYRLYNDIDATLLGDDKAVSVSVGPTLEPDATAALLAAGREREDQLLSRWIWKEWYRLLHEGPPGDHRPGVRALDRLVRRSLGAFGEELGPR